MNLVTLNQTYECKNGKCKNEFVLLRFGKPFHPKHLTVHSVAQGETGCQAVIDGLWLSKKHWGVSQYADISTLYLNRSTLAISSQN